MSNELASFRPQVHEYLGLINLTLFLPPSTPGQNGKEIAEPWWDNEVLRTASTTLHESLLMSLASKPHPKNHKFESATRKNFSSQQFMRHLDVSMSLLEAGKCKLTLAYDPQWTQQHGYFHGGILATLADVAGGYAAFSLIPEDATNVTTEFKINYLAPAKGDRLIGRAEVIRAGKSLTVCRCDVVSVEDGHEQLCAVATSSYMTLYGK